MNLLQSRSGRILGADMANKNERHAENSAGAWYVDTNCIMCGMCSEYGPSVFKESSEREQNIVYHQPGTELELAQAREAMESCPVDSIGCDGASPDE
jgi:ferredoxin